MAEKVSLDVLINHAEDKRSSAILALDVAIDAYQAVLMALPDSLCGDCRRAVQSLKSARQTVRRLNGGDGGEEG